MSPNSSNSVLHSRRIACILAVLVACGSGTLLIHPARAGQADGRNALFQSGGPLGIGRGQSILIGLLLPAVQRVSPGYARVSLRVVTFPGNAIIAYRLMDMRTGGPGLGIRLFVGTDGRLYVDEHATDIIVGYHDRLNIVEAVEMVALGDNNVIPPPCSSMQLIDMETFKVRETVPLNFLPAVQKVQL